MEYATKSSLRVASTDDPRIASIVSVGGGEGFAAYVGTFEGKPAYVVDSGTLNDFLDEDDQLDETVTVLLFDTTEARDQYVEQAHRKQRRVGELDRVRGCLLGGAVGDALGAPVEFLSTADIRRSFGSGGITDLVSVYGRVGAITDDTQMTLFTAEGVIRAQVRGASKGICYPPGVIHHALLRWLHTQGERSPAMPADDEWPDGWLAQQPELYARRAPANTCLSALKMAKHFGDEPPNDSKGCGAIMRVAPIGLFATLELSSESNGPMAFDLACKSAKSTHGHATSTFSSGFFSLVIAYLRGGDSLQAAIASSMPWVARQREAAEVVEAIEKALTLAASDAPSSPETVEQLGGGWVAEEALAISLFCAMRAESFEHGVCLAVNHSGDSDSTGSLVGQLLGTLWGMECIPKRWTGKLELRDVIEDVARDLVGVNQADPVEYWSRYPGW